MKLFGRRNKSLEARVTALENVLEQIRLVSVETKVIVDNLKDEMREHDIDGTRLAGHYEEQVKLINKYLIKMGIAVKNQIIDPRERVGIVAEHRRKKQMKNDI